jgi:hypothetical protein
MFGLSMVWVREMLWGKKRKEKRNKSRYLLACGPNLLVVPPLFSSLPSTRPPAWQTMRLLWSSDPTTTLAVRTMRPASPMGGGCCSGSSRGDDSLASCAVGDGGGCSSDDNDGAGEGGGLGYVVHHRRQGRGVGARPCGGGSECQEDARHSGGDGTGGEGHDSPPALGASIPATTHPTQWDRIGGIEAPYFPFNTLPIPLS